MDKIHTDEKLPIDCSTLKPGEEISFVVGEQDLIGISSGAVKALNDKTKPGDTVKIVCIAPGKFEVWA